MPMKTSYGKKSLKWVLMRTKILDFAMGSKVLGSLFEVNNKRLLRKYHHDSLRLHLGCGGKILRGWINIDSLWRPRVVRLALPEGLISFGDNSVEYIYTCHFLEHLEYPREVMALLKRCHDVLKPGGVMRIAVPDIEVIIDAYVSNDGEFFRVQSEDHHPPWCTTKLEHLMYALQQEGEHKYGYDFLTLRKVLFGAGFQRVMRSSFGQSTFEALKIDYREDGNLTLFVDAIKAPHQAVAERPVKH
jgi:predicted SAM-dependent methyltransferase